MIVGYSISGPDNDSILFEEGWGKPVCQVLDFIENREKYISDFFRVKRSNYNLSFTYDSAMIVSQNFKDFCKSNNYKGLQFYQLAKQKELYLMKSKNVVEFDSKRRSTRFEDYQASCGRYNSVAGATPVCLKSSEKLKDGFYRTDIEFGTGFELSPLMLIGVDTFEKLTNKFENIDFIPIMDKYNSEER